MPFKKISYLLATVKYDELPESVKENTKVNILNFIGGAMGGTDTHLSRAFLELYNEDGGESEANIIGQKGRLPAQNAAMINSSMSEAFLEEDMHMVSQGHPGTVVVPSVLAVGQQLDSGGKEIIEAVVAGYEAVGRFGRCLINEKFSESGKRPSSFLGPFGAAAGVGRLIGLSQEQMMNALSIAGNTSAGILEFANGESADYCYQNAFAVNCGIMAALLAKKGIKSTPTLIEGSRGMGNAFSDGNYDMEALTRNFGNPYEIEDTFIKEVPSCAFSQSTAQAALKMVEKYNLDIEPDDIKKIEIGTYDTAYNWPACVNQGPYAGPVQTMMSHEFVTAAALIYGEVSVRTVKMADDEKILNLTKKTKVYIEPECDALFPPCKGTLLDVYMKNGAKYTVRVKDVSGADRDFVSLRMRRNSSGILAEKAIEEIIEKVMHLEAVNSINDIMKLTERTE